MKKLIAILLAAVMCLSLAACDGKDTSDKMTPKEAVIDAAEWDVQFTLTASGCKGLPSVRITTIEEVGDNEFEFYGTYSAKNEYSQTVNGTFEGTGTYNPETEKASVDIDMK